MPASGPVYQPTTVSYEQQNEWSRPGGYLSQTMHSVRSPRCIQWLLLAFSLFSISVGIIMVVEGLVQSEATQQNTLDNQASQANSGNIVIAVCGAIIIMFGILILAVYIQLVRRRKSCFCFPAKERRLARELGNQVSNGQIMTLNPSTDLLVASSAQFGPASENPPAVTEEETHQLMSNDHKEVIDEHEHMLEMDPRIVLRPLSKSEDA